ncbi:MAG: FecR family protein [Niastella sp.]|uniref:FecR family protein n=1 Tax=Niastella sp. TaxID=1869183 RepID=UPI00389A933F
MIKVPEHILLLIEKQLKGQLGGAEAQTLQQWRSDNRSHETIYRQLEKIWQEAGSILQETVYDEEQAWNKVDQRLVQGNKGKVRPLFRLAMAACIAGVLFIAGWLLYHKPQPSLEVVKADQMNMPVTLPDGSQVILRKGATLSYPKAFSSSIREVTLTGEAWFEVQHDKTHPFRIQTTRATLEVLGTSFTINTNNQQDELAVTTGKVLFTNKTDTTDKQIIYPNQYCALTNKGFQIRSQNDPNFLSWKTGIIKFDNTPINQVATVLSNYYNLNIQPDSLLMKLPVIPTVTAKFDQQPIDSVLTEIKLLANISNRKQNDTILLYKQ